MRHRKIGRMFNRTSSHRKAMLINLSIAIILHERIKTTLPKAKEVRRVLEPLITLSKVDNVFSRRLMFSKLKNNKEIINKIFQIGKRFDSRPGGYLRVLKCGYRKGDAAPMAIVELVDKKLNEDK